jgi:hypothetical protein
MLKISDAYVGFRIEALNRMPPPPEDGALPELGAPAELHPENKIVYQ